MRGKVNSVILRNGCHNAVKKRIFILHIQNSCMMAHVESDRRNDLCMSINTDRRGVFGTSLRNLYFHEVHSLYI